MLQKRWGECVPDRVTPTNDEREDVRDSLMRAAGLDIETTGERVRDVIAKLRALMNADAVTRSHYRGTCVGEYIDPDGSLQLRASEALASLLLKLHGLDADAKAGSNEFHVVAAWFNEVSRAESISPSAMSSDTNTRDAGADTSDEPSCDGLYDNSTFPNVRGERPT